MPIKRQSTSTSAQSTIIHSSSSRHRAGGGFGDMDSRSSFQDTVSINASSSISGEQKVINALVGRIVNKLPCNSGTRLKMMEIDPGIRHTVNSLLQLAKTRLGLVVQALASALETLSKYSSSSSLDTPLDTLHSQLYLHHVLHLSLTASWRSHAEQLPPPAADLPQCWPDPHPLDESLSRYLLSVTMIYIRMLADTATIPGNSSPAPSREGKSIASSSSWSTGVTGTAYGLGPNFIHRHSYPAGSITPPNDTSIDKSLGTQCPTAALTVPYMARLAARTIFYISSSNWPLLLSNLKARITRLTVTNDEKPDMLDVRLLEWCNVNRMRLSQVMQETSSPFLHVKQPAQVALASILRKCIWNFVEIHPLEYESLVESNRKLEGGADMLFDVLYSASDISSNSQARRTKVYYPLMAMILVICPDIFRRAVNGDVSGRTGGGGLGKKAAFLESLRKGITSNKGFEACTVCYTDIIRAAMALTPGLEASGARSMVPDIQNDLKNSLFYSSQSSEISDSAVLVDGLVGLYRVNPVSVTGLLFGKLFADSNEINRIVAVKACVQIVLEDARLPWYPPAEDLRDRVSAAIRSVLKGQINNLVGDLTVIRRPKYAPELPNQNDLMLEILRLYILDPSFALAAMGVDPSDSLRHLLTAISALTVSPVSDGVRALAARALSTIVRALAEGAESDLVECENALWQILIDSGRQGLFAIQSDPEDVNHSFDAFRDICLSLAVLARAHPNVLANSTSGECATLIALVAIISVLVSPDFEQLAQSIPCFQALRVLTLVAHRTYLPGQSPAGTNFGDPEMRIIMRCRLYDDLAKLPPANGRQQQQKQFRKAYRPYIPPTTAGSAVWLGLAAVVKGLNAKISAAEANPTNASVLKRSLAPHIEGLDEDEFKTWQNITLFLASTASVCDYVADPPPEITAVVGTGLLPRVYEESPDPMEICEAFIRECVEHLVSVCIHVRETAKEALGAELPGSLARIMVFQMTRLLSHSLGPEGLNTSETFTTFVEQITLILRLSNDRPQGERLGSGHEVDLSELISLLVQYIHRLGRDDIGVKTKIRFCQLIESVLGNECVILGVVDGGSLRNMLLERLTEWSIEANRDAEANRPTFPASRLHRELEHVCLRATVRVTEGLVLRPPGEGHPSTSLAVKSRLFFREYDHLVKIIDRFPMANLPLTPIQRPHEDAPALAVAAMSNLLSANIDVGLKHCLTLGYHDNIALRTPFMRLISKVLQQGAKFGSLSTKRLSGTPKLYLGTLTGNSANLAFAVAVCEACTPSDVDEMSTLLFRVFEAKGIILDLVKLLVEREIAITNQEHELFRGNSITTRLLTIFAKTYGYNYVRATLQPLIHSLCERPSQSSYELDPSKVGPNDDTAKNADDLQLMCQALLDLVCSSAPKAPILFKAFCGHLSDITETRFPESRHSVIGSFIFLRFFCPAIVAPENVDLDVSPDTREIRRALLMITKIIQNLANNVIFGNKEPHMKALNGFLTENIRQVTKFLLDISVKPNPGEVAASIKTYQEDAERLQDLDHDEEILHRFIHRNLTKIENSLSLMPPTYRCQPGGAKLNVWDLDGRAALRDLRRAIDLTGPPIESGGLSSSARTRAYEDFMRHNSGRKTESVASAFYEGPASQNGRRIFYFIVSRVGLLDYDLLAYHVFSVLDKVTDFFDLVIDLTGFSATTELPMAWLKRSIQMFPPGILPLINILAFYNPNTYARRRVRQIASDLLTVAPPVGKTVIAASSPSELAEFIPFTSLTLPQSTMELAYEAENVFTNLLCVSDHQQQVPVVVKLSQDCMQIASWRKTDLTPSIKSYIIDVIQLRDVDDVLAGAVLPNDFLIVKYSHTESVTFVSRKRNEMAQIIRAARSKLAEGPSEERTLRPSDVPGTLLNVAFLNLSSGGPALRLGAYNLIVDLANLFKFDLDLPTLKAEAGLIIPNNSVAITMSLSASLAIAAPHLTLEFLKEWCLGFSRADQSQRCASLQYIGPWLVNLETFARPSKEDGSVRAKPVEDIIKSLVGITVAESRRLHLAIHERIWLKLADAHEALVEIIVETLLHSALDAGVGSEKAEVAGDIFVSVSNTVVRGRLIARLRKTIAQTYLNPSSALTESIAWQEIATLSRIILVLTFSPMSALDLQLFLPELFHIITLLVGSGPLLMRQTVYGIAINLCQSLATSMSTGNMDSTALQHLFTRLQDEEMVTAFGLIRKVDSEESTLHMLDGEASLDMVETITKFLGQVLEVAAVSIDCANAWRARWMGLVAETCFQHNPSTQPQAFTVLGYLASDEVDDDIIYQILVAMSSTLNHFTEEESILLISMLRCLCRVIPGLSPDSRYATNLFWLSIGILQMGYIPPFATALDLLLVSLKAIKLDGKDLLNGLMTVRRSGGDIARQMDQYAGVSFDSNITFSIVSTVFKGARHPGTRKGTIAVLTEFLKAASTDTGVTEERKQVSEDAVPFFVALLPLVAGQDDEIKNIWEIAGLKWNAGIEVGDMNILALLTVPDNSTALLIIIFAVTILIGASSDHERIVLYRFLADASVEMPDVVSIMYDSLIPRMTAVLGTTSTIPMLRSITQIMDIAMRDPNYVFPPATLIPSESNPSLDRQISYSGSISSEISGQPGGGSVGVGKQQLLEDLGMRGLGELTFANIRMDSVASMARCAAALIDAFTI